MLKSLGISSILFFLLLLLLVIGMGTIGYMLIQGWSLVDAFYMTIITISTVGFREVGDLTTAGKLFTAFLIITSFGTFAYAITSITSYLVGGKYRKYIKDYRIMKELEKLNNHVIITGFGRVGMQVAKDLHSRKIKFVVIENNEETIKENENLQGYIFLKGDSTVDDNLIRAGIKNAKALVCCLPKDADNVYVVLSAAELNARLLIISRATNQSTKTKLKRAGAHNVILPDAVGGSHMASLVSNPDVMEFLDIIRVQGYNGANIESIAFNELPEEFKNKTIGQLEAKRLTGVTIIGFKTPEGEYIINPDYDLEVVPKSKLFVLGNQSQIEKLNKLFGLSH